MTTTVDLRKHFRNTKQPMELFGVCDFLRFLYLFVHNTEYGYVASHTQCSSTK